MDTVKYDISQIKEYMKTIKDNKGWLYNFKNDEEGKETKNDKENKKKTRRAKKIKNVLRDFTVVYQNIRGLKSKVDSVQELVDDCTPNFLCLGGTHTQEEEEITILGYETIYQNDKTSNSGGIK